MWRDTAATPAKRFKIQEISCDTCSATGGTRNRVQLCPIGSVSVVVECAQCLRIGRPATAMLKGDIPKSALKGAPEDALGNRGAQGSALEGALEPSGCSARCFPGSLKALTSLNKEVRPFFLSDNSIWSFPSFSSLSDYSIWRS